MFHFTLRNLFSFFAVLFAFQHQLNAQSQRPKKNASETDLNTVIAEGVGKDEKTALSAAFRDAVSRVVGTLIDAETLIKNDEIIKERILEFSGGFIKTFEKMKTEKTTDGLVRIRIKATVERLGIVTKLNDSKITVIELRGEDLLAEKMTKEEAKKNATELLAKLYSEIPSMLISEVKGKPELTDTRDGLYLNIVISTDLKAYEAFVKKTVPLLDKVAIAKDSILLKSNIDQVYKTLKYDHEKIYNLPSLGQNTPKGYAIWLATRVSNNGSQARWNFYWVDAEPEKSLAHITGDIILNIEFCDSDNKIVIEDEIPIFASNAQSYKDNVKYELPLRQNGPIGGNFVEKNVDQWILWSYRKRNYIVDKEVRHTYSLHISPLIDIYSIPGPGGNSYVKETSILYSFKHKLKISDEELARIKTIKSNVIFRNEKFKQLR